MLCQKSVSSNADDKSFGFAVAFSKQRGQKVMSHVVASTQGRDIVDLYSEFKQFKLNL